MTNETDNADQERRDAFMCGLTERSIYFAHCAGWGCGKRSVKDEDADFLVSFLELQEWTYREDDNGPLLFCPTCSAESEEKT